MIGLYKSKVIVTCKITKIPPHTKAFKAIKSFNYSAIRHLGIHAVY